MADKKISALTGATTPLAGTEVLPIVQSGTTVKVSVDNLTAGKPVSMSNLTYTGTLTGSTGVANIGSGQVYKNASGDIGLTTASPQTRLHLGGATDKTIRVDTALSNAAFYSGWQDTAQIGVNRNPATGAFADTGKAAAAIRLSATNGNSFVSIETTAVNNTAPSQRVVVNSAGDVTVNTGNLVIGTAGKGIDFSADPSAAGMTSELLDDYEEGTWTPTGNGVTYTGVTGTYTKIGNIVTVFYAVTVPATADTNQARLGGLPFTSTNTTGVLASGASDLSVLVDGNSFARFANAAISAYKTNADLSGLSLIGQISYLA